uniref:N-acetyltransferase domain-containing protein n=1 Tax=Panagrolaimus sp. ES5 TaxID=591445 RepID=A0AC34FLV8_9BILA
MFVQLRQLALKYFNNASRFSASTTNYPIPPRLPYIDGFIRDTRNDRKLRSIFNFKSKNCETKKLRIEIADEKDIPLVVQSCADLFINDVNLYKHLNPTYDDLSQLYFDKKAKMFSSGVNFVVKDEDKVVAFTIGDIYDLKDIPEKYQTFRYSKDAKFEFKDDYAEDIKNAQGNTEKARIINAFFEPSKSQIYKFVPSDIRKFFLYEATGIHENYRKSFLYRTLFDYMCEDARKNGAEYMITYCLAIASARQVAKDSDLLIKFPYNRFKENGKIIFYDMCDGAEALEVYGKRL